MNNMLSKALREFLSGPINQLIVNLGGDDGEIWEKEFKKFLRKEKCWTEHHTHPYLRCISEGAKIIIPACEGDKIILDATDLFTGYIDPDFENWGTNKRGQKTKEMPVSVKEMYKDSTFSQMFSGFYVDLDRLCLTQHQICIFIKEHKNWLREGGYATFFLFKSDDNFFVAGVVFGSGGVLSVSVRRFEESHVWHADVPHRVVVPQLA